MMPEGGIRDLRGGKYHAELQGSSNGPHPHVDVRRGGITISGF
jgi:hypothetical protein